MKDLFAALTKAFAEIEGAAKDKVNPAFRAKYADLASVVDAVKPALVKHGLGFAQITHDAENGVCIETIVYHASGAQMGFGKLFVPATKHDAQGYGSALTYARRYSLLAAFGVAPEDDDGNAAAKSAPVQNSAVSTAKPRPEPLKGKYKTRAAARVAYGEIVRELNACEDESTLDAYLESIQADIEQFEAELELAWKGDGADFIGMEQEIKNARERCTSAAGEHLVDLVRAG